MDLLQYLLLISLHVGRLSAPLPIQHPPHPLIRISGYIEITIRFYSLNVIRKTLDQIHIARTNPRNANLTQAPRSRIKGSVRLLSLRNLQLI